LLGAGKMILLVHSLCNEKISSQISIILWIFEPIQYIMNFFKIKKHTQNKKHVFIEK